MAHVSPADVIDNFRSIIRQRNVTVGSFGIEKSIKIRVTQYPYYVTPGWHATWVRILSALSNPAETALLCTSMIMVYSRYRC